MTHLTYADQLAALRGVVFTAVEDWNAKHPHPLGSRREHAAVNVTQVFTDAGGEPSFTIIVTCPLAGSASLNFHGQDLPAVVEHARLTLEHRIAAEVERRAARALETGLDRKFGVAV